MRFAVKDRHSAATQRFMPPAGVGSGSKGRRHCWRFAPGRGASATEGSSFSA